MSSRAEALVQWLWEETHVLTVVGPNPSTICLMDISQLIFFKNRNIGLKKTEN